MADVLYYWGAYGRLQSRLSETTSVTIGGALEEALNIILQPDFNLATLNEADMLRLGANAARQERHRSSLRRQVQARVLDEATAARGHDDVDVSTGASSLDDELHARRELQRISDRLPGEEWDLLTGVAAGVSYDELAVQHSSTSAALRSRVCRLRHALMVRRNGAH